MKELVKSELEPTRFFKPSKSCFHSGHVPPKPPLNLALLFFWHSCTALPLFHGILQTPFPLNPFMLSEHSVNNYSIPVWCCLFCLISAWCERQVCPSLLSNPNEAAIPFLRSSSSSLQPNPNPGEFSLWGRMNSTEAVTAPVDAARGKGGAWTPEQAPERQKIRNFFSA